MKRVPRADQPTSQPRRSLLLLHQFANPLGSPGGTRHAELFAFMDGWQATVVTGATNLFDGEPQRGLGPGWVTVRTTPYGPSAPSRIASWITWAAGAVAKGIRMPRPDVVFASSPQLLAGAAGALLAARWRVPFVFEVRDLWPDVLVHMGTIRRGGALHRSLAALERRLYERASLVVCLAEGVAEELRRRGVPARKIAFVPNGADPDSMKPPAPKDILRRRLGLPPDRLIFVYAGAHGVANGLHLLLEAARELAGSHPEALFVLVGDGPAKESLVRQAEEMRLTNVVFRDPLPKSDVPALLGAVDVGVHVLADVELFRWGVSPNKIFDYMAAGLPIVTNTPGEVSDMVTTSAAGVATAPRELASGLSLMAALSDEERRSMGERGRRWLRENRDRRTLACKMQRLLDDLVDQANCGRPYRGKRLLDLLLLIVVSPVAIPMGLLCALAVKLTSRGPVLFRQERVGMGGEVFEVLKFRTMVHSQNPLFPDPDRITPVGRVLRRTSLDELPQLLNVARGEMSIVGPRPTLRYQVERYTPRQKRRLAVKPGITGLAQVSGRNSLTWSERIELDLEYVERQSLWLDLKILAKTLGAVVSGGGVEGHPRDDPIAAPPSDAVSEGPHTPPTR
ncbi:MAG: hypothetical protein KatS3mg008_0569 [Acidimicrobiales bacterium]|nr:MAG: hypothetical protein KatS3mg008_0569 [Acidimicrobiales bacterium]